MKKNNVIFFLVYSRVGTIVTTPGGSSYLQVNPGNKHQGYGFARMTPGLSAVKNTFEIHSQLFNRRINSYSMMTVSTEGTHQSGP